MGNAGETFLVCPCKVRVGGGQSPQILCSEPRVAAARVAAEGALPRPHSPEPVMTIFPRRAALAALATSSLLLLAADPAQGQTERYRYRLGGNNYAVSFLDSDQGIVTRDGGGALYSTDGGDTWTEAEVPPSVRKQLRNIFLVDDEVAWTVGGGGVALKTTSRGTVWTHVNSSSPVLNRYGQPASLYDIWMFDADHGICVGEDGTFASTSNGGAMWASINLPLDFYDASSSDPIKSEPGDLYQIHWLDADNGILSADHGRILKTQNGGGTWSLSRFSGYCGYEATGDLELWSMSFDGNEGWLAGGNGFNNAHAFHTANGGAAWAQVRYMVPVDSAVAAVLTSPAPENDGGWPTFYGVAALGNGSAVVSGYAGRIYEYSGSGSQSMDAIDRCAFTDPMAPTSNPSLIHKTPLTWSGPGLDPGSPPLNSIFALGVDERWVVGQFGSIQRWNPSPAGWEERGTVTKNRFRDMDFLDATTGIVVGQGHRIYKTEDGAATFDEVYQGTSNEYDMVVVALSRKSASLLGLAAGAAGLIVRTDDHGDTWTSVNTPHIVASCLAFGAGSDVAYVGASGGNIYSTDVSVLTGGDLTWSLKLLPETEYEVTGLSFTSATTGYAVTSGMQIWRTTDGGDLWTAVGISNPPSATQGLRAIAAFDGGNKAVAVGNAGLLLVRNAGRFEVVDVSGMVGATQLNTVTVLGNGARVVVAGNDGVVLEFEGTNFADALNPSNWTAPKSMTSGHIYDLSFDAVDHGFVLGQQGLVVEYD